MLFLTTWFGTYEFWKGSLPFGIPLGLGLEFLLHASALSSVPMVIINIYTSYTKKTGKMRTPLEAARPFFPFLTFLALFMYWMFNSPNNVIDTDTRVVFLLTGTIFSNASVSTLEWIPHEIDNYLFIYLLSNAFCDPVFLIIV